MNLPGAIHERLAADATLVAMLAQYRGEPAIFCEAAPADWTPDTANHKPSIVVDYPHINESDDDFSSAYRNSTLNVRVYAKDEGTDKTKLDNAAERVRALSKGWSSYPKYVAVSGPVPAPTDDPSLSGRVLSIQLLTKE